MERKSTFTGSNWGLIWRSIVMVLGASFTILIASPWLISWFAKWFCENLIVDGKPMRFEAEGRDLMKPIYIFLLLSIVTFGIAPIFMMAWILRQVTPFVHHEVEPVAVEA